MSPELCLSLLLSWTVNSPGETDLDRAFRFAPWCFAMADSDATDTEAKSLLAIGALESRFQTYVVDESCNDNAWRKTHSHVYGCDGGRAFGPYQMHEGTWTAVHLRGATPEVQTAIALKLFRAAPQLWTSWPRAKKLVAEVH